ncbi:hypothetical protein TRVA0_037S00782 [Trichomonascus vanleenenianus]|uniref:uncharacterized protein n=1 Tax=Trichomonascus vanleenenianus TaxID=2268995 RepID=UPI003ECAF30F
MGRRKIAIQPITDERNRSVTFLKRKGGLFKKAHELAVLCQVDIAVIIFGSNKKLYEFSSGDTNQIIQRYQMTDKPHESKGPRDYDKTLGTVAKDQSDEEVSEEEEGSDNVNVSNDSSPMVTQNTRQAKAQPSPRLKHRAARPAPVKKSSLSAARRHSRSFSAANASEIEAQHAHAAPQFNRQSSHPPVLQGDQNPQDQQRHQPYNEQAKQEPLPGPQAMGLRTNPQYEYISQPPPGQTQSQMYHRYGQQPYSPSYALPPPPPPPLPPGAGQYPPPPPGYAYPQQQQAQQAPPSEQYTAAQKRNYPNYANFRQPVQMTQSQSQPPAEYTYAPVPGKDNNSLAYGVVQPQRPQSVDVAGKQPEQERKGSKSPTYLNNSRFTFPNTPSNSGNSANAGNQRPKLKVQIPGENNTPISSSGRIKGESSGGDDATNSAKDEKPLSAGSGNNKVNTPTNVGGNQGPTSGGPWGSSLTLPPPSPSTYLNSNNAQSGPGNPFGRPPLVNANGEQTPLSAALPSKYVHDLLPSPSNFYGSEWNMHFGPASGGLGSATNRNPPVSGSAHSGYPSGITLGPRANHLASDILPSPLQFNTPIVAASSQSMADRVGTTITASSSSGTNGSERKREGEVVSGNNAKRIKQEDEKSK